MSNAAQELDKNLSSEYSYTSHLLVVSTPFPLGDSVALLMRRCGTFYCEIILSEVKADYEVCNT